MITKFSGTLSISCIIILHLNLLSICQGITCYECWNPKTDQEKVNCFLSRNPPTISCPDQTDRCFSVVLLYKAGEQGAEYGCISESQYTDIEPFLDPSKCIVMESHFSNAENHGVPMGVGYTCFCEEDKCNNVNGNLRTGGRRNEGQRSPRLHNSYEKFGLICIALLSFTLFIN